MAPAATSSESLKNTLDKAAKAIEDYADAIEPVKTTLETLEQEAESFRAEALEGYDGKPWREHQPAVDRNAELLDRYAAVVETLTTASTACANTINGLYTQSCPAVVEAISADAIMHSGEMMPWGAPVEKDRNCGESVVHGAGNFLKSTWDGAKAMVGFGPEGWSLDTLASTWVGVADFVGSTALLASPVLSQGIKFFGGDEVDKWVDERHDVAKTALGSFVGYDHQAAKQGGDGWHRWKEDGVAALTESVLNIGTCFIPGAGQAGAATKVGLAGTKVALAGSKVSTVASVVTKVTKVTVKVADNLIPGGGHLVEGVAKLVNVGADTVRGVDDVASVKPAKTPGAPTPHTPVTNTHGLGGGNRVVTNGPNLMQDVKAPKAPAAPVGDVADLAGEAGAKKAPKVDTALDEADPTATTQRPRASDAVDGLDSSRAPESRAPEGAGSRAPEMEQSRAPEADSVKASHTPESRAAEAETTRRPEGAGARAPEVDSSKLPEPDRPKTVDVEASRAPEVDTAKTPEASGAKAPEVEASRIPEAGKSSDVPEAERMPQEPGTRGTDAAAEVNPGRTPDAGDGLDAPEVRDGSAEPGRAGTDANEGLGDGAPEGTSPKDPNQWPGEELAPGAERRPVPKGDRDWWYDEDGYPHEKGDPDPENTFRGKGGNLHSKEGGKYVTDPNPPERVDGPETVKAKYGEYTPDENVEGVTEKAQEEAAFSESVEKRNAADDLHQAKADHLGEVASKLEITPEELKVLKGEDGSELLDALVSDGRVSKAEARELKAAIDSESQAMKALKNASELMGEAGAEGVMKAREEISLLGADSRPGAGHLDKIGVRLDPPRISIYEAKGGGGPLGTSKVDGIPHQQGTGPYLQKLMEQDPRIAQALADLIECHGSKADALKEAIARGDVEITYELVRSRPNGKIKLSKFQLDKKPQLPDGIIDENQGTP